MARKRKKTEKVENLHKFVMLYGPNREREETFAQNRIEARVYFEAFLKEKGMSYKRDKIDVFEEVMT